MKELHVPGLGVSNSLFAGVSVKLRAITWRTSTALCCKCATPQTASVACGASAMVMTIAKPLELHGPSP